MAADEADDKLLRTSLEFEFLHVHRFDNRRDSFYGNTYACPGGGVLLPGLAGCGDGGGPAARRRAGRRGMGPGAAQGHFSPPPPWSAWWGCAGASQAQCCVARGRAAWCVQDQQRGLDE